MGNKLSRKKTTKNRVSNSTRSPKIESLEMENNSEEIHVPDTTTKHKTKTTSLLPFKKKSLSIQKTTSFQSAVTYPNRNLEVERLLRLIEKLKAGHENQIIEIEMEKKQLVMEVTRLRNEVKMLNTELPKLRADKQKAKGAESDALERATSIKSEKDKIQHQFKLFQETSEKEIQRILYENQKFLALLQKYTDVSEIRSSTGHMQHLITDWLFASQSDTEVGNARQLKRLDSIPVSEMMGLVDAKPNKDISDVLQQTLASLYKLWFGVPAGNVYNVFVKHHEEMSEFIKLLKFGFYNLSLQCEMEARFFNYFFCEVENKTKDDASKEFFDTCDVVLIIQSSSYQIAKDTVEKMLKAGKICIVAGASIGDSIGTLIKDNRKLYVVQETTEQSKMVESCVKECSKICKMFLEKQRVVSSHIDDNNELSTLPLQCWDLCNHLEQKAIRNYQSSSKVLHMNIDNELVYLDNYITQDGPVQPLLVCGPVGSGKSFLLSNWVEHLENSLINACVLSHSVVVGSMNSKCPVQLLRRFSHILLGQLPPSCKENFLKKEFPVWLDRSCQKYKNGVVIVIDGTDLLDKHAEYLKWLLDPLPIHVRVVIAVNSRNFPKVWSKWPVLEIKGCFDTGMQHFKDILPQNLADILDETLSKTYPDNVYNKSVSNNLSSLLFHDLFVSALKYINNDFSALLNQSLNTLNIKQMFVLIIQLFATKYGEIVGTVLKSLALSCNGLSFGELLEYCEGSLQCELYHVLHVAVRLHLVWQMCGLYQISRLQVLEAIYSYYNLKDSEDSARVIHKSLSNLFLKKFEGGFVTYRVADELPWQLKQANLRQELRSCLESFTVFFHHWQKGKLLALVEYWKWLNVNITAVHEIYTNKLKMLERNVEQNQELLFTYDTLGEFMQEYSEYKHAQHSFERALELKELHLESDSLPIGESFLRLAKLFTQWGKFQTAENYFQQVIQINATHKDEVKYINILEPLAVLYLHQGRLEDANLCRKQVNSIRQRHVHEAKNLKEKAKECHSLSQMLIKEELDEKNIEFLVDVGTVYFNLEMHEEAVNILYQALETYKRLFGANHPLTADVMCKLSFVYQSQNLLDKALPLLEKAYEVFLVSYPVDSVNVQDAVKNLTKIFKKQQKFDQLEQFYRNLIDFQEQQNVSTSTYAASLNVLAVHLSKLERYDEALDLYHRSLQAYTTHVSFDHSSITDILSNMAKSYYGQGDMDTAAHMYKLSMDPNRTMSQLSSSSEASAKP